MVGKVGLWVPLLRVDEVGELHWVTDEEHGGVVPSHIPVAVLSVELDGEAPWVAVGIGGTLLSSDC